MSGTVPQWLAALSDEDLQFIRRFVLASGSLKALAKEYSVSYPTLRARLDRLIAKINAIEEPRSSDPFERQVRILVADGKLPASLAKSLLESHKASLNEKNKSRGGKRK